MKIFLIKNLEIEELKNDRPVFIDVLNSDTTQVVRGDIAELQGYSDIKRLRVNPVHYYAPNGDEYFIASHPHISEKLTLQIDSLFELCKARDRLHDEKNKLRIRIHGLTERNDDLIQQVNKYDKMSFWKRLKFAITGTCL